MPKFSNSFEEYLVTSSAQIPIIEFIINLFLATALSLILSQIYIKYGNSLSNRKLFGKNFFMIAITTMVIITIVKSSLALSLGLVGALSIVRFRTAIKEPEELSYLFLNIAIGLGLGANQVKITTVSFIVIISIIILKSKLAIRNDDDTDLCLVVHSDNPDKLQSELIIEKLKDNCSMVKLKRIDENKEMLELAFDVTFDSYENLNQVRAELKKLDKSISLSFLDNKGFV